MVDFDVTFACVSGVCKIQLRMTIVNNEVLQTLSVLLDERLTLARRSLWLQDLCVFC